MGCLEEVTSVKNPGNWTVVRWVECVCIERARATEGRGLTRAGLDPASSIMGSQIRIRTVGFQSLEPAAPTYEGAGEVLKQAQI